MVLFKEDISLCICNPYSSNYVHMYVQFTVTLRESFKMRTANDFVAHVLRHAVCVLHCCICVLISSFNDMFFTPAISRTGDGNMFHRSLVINIRRWSCLCVIYRDDHENMGGCKYSRSLYNRNLYTWKPVFVLSRFKLSKRTDQIPWHTKAIRLVLYYCNNYW